MLLDGALWKHVLSADVRTIWDYAQNKMLGMSVGEGSHVWFWRMRFGQIDTSERLGCIASLILQHSHRCPSDHIPMRDHASIGRS